MLLEMSIENFILIRQLSLSFNKGLNVFTGETGAGKSMIIGGINAGLGEKIQGDVVGFNADKAVIQLVFQVESRAVLDLLNQVGVDLEDDILIISREIFPSHRSVVRMNGRIVTLAVLKEVSAYLLDIHGQHAHQALLYPKNHLYYLDLMGDQSHQTLLREVEVAYAAVKTAQAAIKEHEDKIVDVDVDYLRFQINEIDSLNLKPEDEEGLEQKYAYYKNMEEIFSTIQQVQGAFTSDDHPYGLKDIITQCSQWIHKISSYDGRLSEIADQIDGLMYQIDDLNGDLRQYADHLDVDEEEMYQVEARMNEINTLKIKHGTTIDVIINKRNHLMETLQEAENYEAISFELHEDIKAKKKDYLESAGALHDSRLILKEVFENKVTAEMKMLNMAHGQFEVSFQENQLSPGAYKLSKLGIDDISFNISTNPGMPLGPLSKIASGGEISRIMLAIKMALAHNDQVTTLVFDEVDTGISGHTARIVGEKMHLMTKNYQVILITHLPQITVMADHHFKIDKMVVNGLTESSVFTVNSDLQLKEIARMLSGNEDSQVAIQNAEEMIMNARLFKVSQ